MKKDFVDQRGAKIWMCGNFNPLFFVLFFLIVFLIGGQQANKVLILFMYLFTFNLFISLNHSWSNFFFERTLSEYLYIFASFLFLDF